MLGVRHLEMVRAIHAEGTLTAAARRLYISQPALSRQLGGLERRMGVQLFRRQHDGMTLTREGHRLLESAERILRELERAEHDVKLLARGMIGTVRVSTECYMCYHWLPWVVRAFSARFPRVEVQLVPEATRDPYGALERGGVDVALVYGPPPAGGAIHRVELFHDEIVGVVASDHPLAGRPHLEPGDFSGETLLCHYAEPGRGVLEEDFLSPAGVRPRTLELQVTPAVVEMACAGCGVAAVPRWILDSQRSLDGLAVLSLGERGLWRTWSAACYATRRDEPVLASMIRTLRDELQREGSPAATREPRLQLA
ncbi:MAG TPA: LysR substrate-binding domain-containing protein [Longimicrobium sp.]|nr:LysR substrate-binding domain-containing protein [Longimicrobium sp.]